MVGGMGVADITAMKSGASNLLTCLSSTEQLLMLMYHYHVTRINKFESIGYSTVIACFITVKACMNMPKRSGVMQCTYIRNNLSPLISQ